MRRGLVIAAVALASIVPVLAPATTAAADSVQQKQREASRIADRIEALGNQSDDLVDQYNQALEDLAQSKQDVADQQATLARLDQDLGGLRGRMATFAVKAYVYADQTNGLAGLLSGDSLVDGAAQREGYSALALGANVDLAGDMKAKLEDATYQQTVLANRQAKQEKLAKVVDQRRKAVDAAQAEATDLLAQVKGELATLVEQERQRREAAAAAAAQAAFRAAQAAAAARASVATRPSGSNRPAGVQVVGNVAARAASPAPAPGSPEVVAAPAAAPLPAPARVVRQAPPPSAGAAGAVAAAMSMLGTPYRFANASPDTGFDCSGLMVWAWGRAGVGLPRTSRQQLSSVPRISFADLQPGDLVFTRVGHVAMYVGNGMMIHSPNTGSVVKLAALNPGHVVGYGRPG